MDRDDAEMEDVQDRRREPSRERSPERREDSDRRERRGSRDNHRSARRTPSRSRSRSPRRTSHRHRSRSYSPDRRRSHRERSRSRSPPRERSRSRDREDHRRYSSSRRDRDTRDSRDYRRPAEGGRSVGGPMNAPLSEAAAHAKVSVKENRVYVGNLPYNCTYQDLKNALKEAGEVVFAEIFVTPAGQSKGCGIVEYADRESAAAAIHDLAQKPILGRPCFIREDREAEARFGATPIPGKIGVAMGEAPPFRGAPFAGRGGFGGGFGGPAHNPTEYKQLFIGNLPLTATWQDMKDLFREAGNVVRADVSLYPNGAPKGTGIVVYETHADAKNAVEKMNGYQWGDNVLQVRPDRFASMPSFRGGRGGFMGGRGGFMPRGGFMGGRGGFGGQFGGGFGGPMMGNHMGGMGGGMRGGRNFTNDLYADYNGPEGGAAVTTVVGGNGIVAPTGPAANIEPSVQIMVRNLPWSTTNEDLVELFETTGQVVLAEILYEGTRSKGSGVVQFKEVEEATEACEKFTGYVYGGRPLDVQYNDRWHTFAQNAAAGGSVAAA